MSNEGYFFKIGRLGSGSSLRLVTPTDEVYQVDDNDAYLNSQAVTGNYCFFNGLNGQRGYEITNGAVWKVEYVDGKGWSIKNVGTGKYLKDTTHPAMFEEPTYFTFCTLKEDTTTGIEALSVKSEKKIGKSGIYTLDGRKVNSENLRPGLYIVNGEKVVIK